MTRSKPNSSSQSSSYYVDYHLVSCIEDTPRPKHRFQRTDLTVPVAFFTSIVIVSFIGAFGIKLAITFRRFRDSLTIRPSQQAELAMRKVVHEPPVRMASRALAWGTMWAFVGTGAVGFTTFNIWKL